MNFKERAKEIEFSTNAPNKTITIKAIESLYQFLEIKKPKIIFCDSIVDLGKKIENLGGEPAIHAGGMFDVDWIFSALKELESNKDNNISKEMVLKLPVYAILAEQVGHMAFYDTHAFCCRKPINIHVKDNRLHYETGPAVEYIDGTGVYYIDGVYVGKKCVLYPETYTIDEINDINNEERKSIVIERFGFNKYIKKSKLSLLDSSKFGELYEDKNTYLAKLTNHSKEPDGSYQNFFITLNKDDVPKPTAHSFVSRSFCLDTEYYGPQIET